MPRVPPMLRAAVALPVLVTTFFVLSRCETAVDPFVESKERCFSIGGYLDALADTQFVRVMPVRYTLFPAPDPIDALVTLEHLASGHKATWRDSLFLFQDGSAAHNFWSTEPLAPLETYRFTVERSDGVASAATVTLPDTFPDPVLCASVDRFHIDNPPAILDDPPIIIINGIERYAAVEVIYEIQLLNTPSRIIRKQGISHMDDIRITGIGDQVTVSMIRDLQQIASTQGAAIEEIIITEVEVRVAAAGSDWPDAGLDLETLALPEVVANIEKGWGFLGSVASKTVPWPELLHYLNAARLRVGAVPPPAEEPEDELCQLLRPRRP